MSITKYQSPDTTTINHKVHQMINPEYFTAISTNSTSYDDFHYRFSIVDSTGTLYSSKQSPLINNAIGLFSPTQIISNYLESYFYPTITTWTDVTSYCMKQYRVDVEEYYSGEVKTATLQSYYKQHVMNATKKDFDYRNHLLNESTKKFLTNQSTNTTIKIREKDYATVRFLNGTFTYLSSSIYKSRPYEIRAQLTRGSNVYVYRSTYNPWWSGQTPLNSSSSVWDNRRGCVVEFPVGPKNIESMTWYLISLNGISVGPTLLTNPKLYPGDKYEIYAYLTPNGEQSQRYKYEVVCVDESFNSRVMLYWENECGGWSNYLCEMRNTETSNVERYSFRKNYDEFGKASQTTSTYYTGHNTYSKETTVYGGEETRNLSVWTDWLSSYDLDYLNDIMRSRNIYINYNDTFYPVININESQMVKNSRDEMYQINFDLQMANKNIF